MNNPTTNQETNSKEFLSEQDRLLQARKEAMQNAKSKMDLPKIKWLTENSRKFLESGYLTGDTTPEERILEIAIEAEKTIFQNTSGADCTVCTYGGIMEYDKKNGFSKGYFSNRFQSKVTPFPPGNFPLVSKRK